MPTPAPAAPPPSPPRRGRNATASVPPPGPPRKRGGCGIVALILVVAIAGGGYWAYHRLARGGAGITVRIPPDQLQSALQKAFPVDRHELFIDVHLSDPTVSLDGSEGDRIGFGTTVGTSIRGRKMVNGSLTASGELRYDAPTRTFYLDSPKISDLKIDRVGGPEAGLIKKAVSYVLNKAIRHLPVDQLDPTDPAQALAAHGIRAVRVNNGAVEITVGATP